MSNVSLYKKKVAVIAGSGGLPEEVIGGLKKLNVDFAIIRFSDTHSPIFDSNRVINATFEKIADLFLELKYHEFTSIVCCGYMRRPTFDLNMVDQDSQAILEPVLNNFKFGDEAIFSSLLAIFKQNKLQPLSIREFIPNSFPTSEFLTNLTPTSSNITDALRSEEILRIISPADLGQSVVVRNGSCLAVETALGTDSMLNSLKFTDNLQGDFGIGGVLYKAPKIEQNPFLDVPVIGKQTIRGVKKAKLSGVVIKNSSVVVLELEETINLANELGIFIWSKK